MVRTSRIRTKRARVLARRRSVAQPWGHSPTRPPVSEHDRPPQPHESDGPDGSAPRAAGGTGLALAARALVAFELAQWPASDDAELVHCVERLGTQGRQLGAGVEALIVELKHLINRHVAPRASTQTCRQLRERLVTVLIEAYYRGGR